MSEYSKNLYLDNLSGELYDFFVKFGGFTLEKIKLGKDPHVDGLLRKI